ncbi:uncharacterized protein [Montipora foliosa]|uniref:uncharacterized protein isoform X2 n=1 Tax=Montipora foliosa TaxID=591990 RepID=UPI0035F2085B
MLRGDPVCRKEDCSYYDIGLVFKEISSYSDQDKLKFIENVWKPGQPMQMSRMNHPRVPVLPNYGGMRPPPNSSVAPGVNMPMKTKCVEVLFGY